jgi:hypothetical protein
MKTMFAWCLLLVVIGGCVKSPNYARNDPFMPAQIQISDDDLRKNTAFSQPIVSRDAAGLLLVTVPLRAATDLTLYVDYRTTFFDRTGRPIQQTGWLNKTLYPNVFDNIQINSVSPEAADFEMDLRYARVR